MNNEPDYNDNLYFERKNNMTQRIFDIENEKDMADLWDILPDNIVKIKQRFQDGSGIVYYTTTGSCVFDSMGIIKINWHDKTEITRPIQEATDADIGKICYFWDKEKSGCYAYGELLPRGMNSYIDFPYEARNGRAWKHCRRLTKQEIEELI